MQHAARTGQSGVAKNGKELGLDLLNFSNFYRQLKYNTSHDLELSSRKIQINILLKYPRTHLLMNTAFNENKQTFKIFLSFNTETLTPESIPTTNWKYT